MNESKNTTVRHLSTGDVLAGSGFTVTRRPYSQVRTPKGRVVVEGHYPGQPVRAHLWNPSTTVHVVVDNPSHVG